MRRRIKILLFQPVLNFQKLTFPPYQLQPPFAYGNLLQVLQLPQRMFFLNPIQTSPKFANIDRERVISQFYSMIISSSNCIKCRRWIWKFTIESTRKISSRRTLDFSKESSLSTWLRIAASLSNWLIPICIAETLVVSCRCSCWNRSTVFFISSTCQASWIKPNILLRMIWTTIKHEMLFWNFTISKSCVPTISSLNDV